MVCGPQLCALLGKGLLTIIRFAELSEGQKGKMTYRKTIWLARGFIELRSKFGTCWCKNWRKPSLLTLAASSEASGHLTEESEAIELLNSQFRVSIV